MKDVTLVTLAELKGRTTKPLLATRTLTLQQNPFDALNDAFNKANELASSSTLQVKLAVSQAGPVVDSHRTTTG